MSKRNFLGEVVSTSSGGGAQNKDDDEEILEMARQEARAGGGAGAGGGGGGLGGRGVEPGSGADGSGGGAGTSLALAAFPAPQPQFVPTVGAARERQYWWRRFNFLDGSVTATPVHVVAKLQTTDGLILRIKGVYTDFSRAPPHVVLVSIDDLIRPLTEEEKQNLERAFFIYNKVYNPFEYSTDLDSSVEYFRVSDAFGFTENLAFYRLKLRLDHAFRDWQQTFYYHYHGEPPLEVKRRFSREIRAILEIDRSLANCAITNYFRERHKFNNAFFSTPLKMAVNVADGRSISKEIVPILLGFGADPNKLTPIGISFTKTLLLELSLTILRMIISSALSLFTR